MTADSLPWASSFAWLTGRQCRARLDRGTGEPFGRWGRCELRYGHVAADESDHVDHAMEFGMEVVRWPAWTAGTPYREIGFGR